MPLTTKCFFQRLLFKLTSGRFIFTLVVAGVYAYLSCLGVLKEDRIMEITLIVLYAYFNKPRPYLNGNSSVEEDEEEIISTTTTTTLPPK